MPVFQRLKAIENSILFSNHWTEEINMQSSNEVAFRTSQNWHSIYEILEAIFDHLDLPDLKSASLVCTAWCCGAKKAFENRANPIIKDASQAASLEHAIQRFGRHKTLAFHFDCNPESSVATLISSAKLPFLSKLILQYEGTWELVVSVNELLRQLTNGSLAQITELELRPQGDTPCIKPENSQVSDHSAMASVQYPSQLRILKVIVGHTAMLELDWSFLKSCNELTNLHLLGLNFILAGFGNQLSRLVTNLPTSIKGSGLHLDVLWGNGDLDSWPQADANAVIDLFKTIKPASFSLNFQNYTQTSEMDETLVIYKEICRLLTLTSGQSLTRFVFQLTIDDLTSDTMLEHTCSIAAATPAVLFKDLKTIVIISLNVDFGGGSKSYFEFEATTFSLDVAHRFGPVHPIETQDARKQLFRLICPLTKGWGTQRFISFFGGEPENESVLRHYEFDKSIGKIIQRAQKNRQVYDIVDTRFKLKWIPTECTEPSTALLYKSATSSQRSCPVPGFPSATSVCLMFSEK